MKHGVLEYRRRLSHRREPEYVDKIPDLQWRALLRKHAESLALTLKKKCVPRLLVADNATHSHPVPRSFPGENRSNSDSEASWPELQPS